MFTYIIKRILLLIPTLIGITLVTFTLLKCIPGDPVYGLIGERASPEIIQKYKSEIGLGGYRDYLKMICRGDLGYSYYTKEPIWRTFIQKFPNTLKLALAAILIAVIGGVILGVVAAVKQNSFWDRAILLGTTCGISLPIFWWGLILIIVFVYTLKWFPGTGMGGGQLVYLVLPAAALGLRSVAYLARVTRASMLEVFSQPYIVSARARGVGKWKLVMKHSFRNALIPVVTMAALDLGSYLNGAVLIETVFNWDGVGRWAVTAIFKRDYPVILAVVLWGALIFVIVNLVVDIMYQYINPRMIQEPNRSKD